MKHLSVDILNTFPTIDEAAVDVLLEKEIAANHDKIVVLDDDPTGVQTVHDVSVYTDWSEESVRDGFEEDRKLFYILTNSRGMTREETTEAHQEIGRNIALAAKECAASEPDAAEESGKSRAADWRKGKSYIIMSRSDSTLRGHYPLETELLKEAMEQDGIRIDGEVLCPFFKEGGRYTIGNIHYVKQGEELVPAAETEFAKDPTFGYTKSSIPEYIEEKTGGKYKAADVTCISLEDLRACRYDAIEEQLLSVHDFNKICVNAVDYCDLKVFAVALYRAMAKGHHFMFRTAAGLVKVMGGVSDIPLLSRKDMVSASASADGVGGVVVVGSHTKKTTDQLTELLKLDCTVPVEFNSNLVLDGDDAFYAEVDRCVAREEEIIRSGKTAVCYTCRKLLETPDDTKESALLRSVKISDGVQKLVGELKITPAFVVAKGGITSSDVGVKALAVKRANVLGQIQPGIPVWQTGKESRFPGTPYVIFPGNTGDEETLRKVVEILTD